MDIAVNYLAVLVAAVVSYAIGAVWHSPLGFGKQWMKMMGLDKESMRKMPLTAQQAMILGFLFTLLVSYILSHFIVIAGVRDLPGALTLGFWLWLGFGITTLANGWLWEGKSLKLFLFNAAYLLVSFESMALVFGLWR